LNVLVILGHPRADSLCGALADAYFDGARAAGVHLRRLDLSTLEFDPHVRTPSPNQQPLEADLRAARSLVEWADHLVFVYPTWWGTMPSLLKGFLDRIMTPGFAFRPCEGGTGYEGLSGPVRAAHHDHGHPAAHPSAPVPPARQERHGAGHAGFLRHPAGVTLQVMGLAQGAYAGLGYLVIPHGAWLAWLLLRELGRHKPPGRIDGLMGVSLGYVLWFGLIPLINLASG
jgi:NAD(P)H-dependent FMN reductase